MTRVTGVLIVPIRHYLAVLAVLVMCVIGCAIVVFVVMDAIRLAWLRWKYRDWIR